jgi:hypothetical protein
MLFLGFSFDDPNIEIMLRLARSLDSPRVHYTVMRKPIKTLDRRLHDLRVRDLERSGISVYEVDSFDDIEPTLAELMRRTRPPSIFISGSPQEGIGVDFTATCRAIGSRLAELPIALSSLAGKAAGIVSHAFAATLRQHGDESAAETIRFYFNSPGKPKSYSADVVGTQIYTQQTDDVLRRSAMKDCRVMVLIGGGIRTGSEVRIAKDLGIPIVPVAATGGRARDYWESLTLENSGLPIPKAKLADAELHWAALAKNDVNAVALAVHRLAKWASYLE